MVFTNAISTRMYSAMLPVEVAAVKIMNFEKNPAKGGIPAREKSARVMAKLNQGLVL